MCSGTTIMCEVALTMIHLERLDFLIAVLLYRNITKVPRDSLVVVFFLQISMSDFRSIIYL